MEHHRESTAYASYFKKSNIVKGETSSGLIKSFVTHIKDWALYTKDKSQSLKGTENGSYRTLSWDQP